MPTHLPFPDELVSPEVKETRQYHVQYVQAAYSATNRFGGRLFEADSDYDSLVEFAQGHVSVDNIGRLFGIIRDAKTYSDPNFDGPESLINTDLKALSIASRYINRAVAKMTSMNYDIILGATDIATMDEVKDYEAAVKAYYRLKEWMTAVKIDPQEFFPDIDIASLPDYSDELLFQGKVNPKVKKVIDTEKTIQLLHYINNMRETLRQVCWDIVVIGRGHFEIYLDEKGIPRAKRIDPKYWFGSYVDNEDFSKQEYAGYIEFITINQFKKEAYGHLPEKEIKETCEHFSYLSSLNTNPSVLTHESQRWDGLGYIPVIRYYFLSNDKRTYLINKTKYGNPAINEVPNDYQIPEFNVKPDTKLVTNEVTSVYGGTWVIDSDVVYNYGRKQYPRTNLVDISLPIKTFAPNMKYGRVVSFTSQLIEPSFMMNVAWNKIKEIIAKGWMGTREIDLNQLEKVSIGRGGRAWSSREVYEYFKMSGELIKRGQINKHDQSYGEAVRDVQNGLTLTDHFNTFTMAIRVMESMTGSSLVEQFDQPNRLAVGVMEASTSVGDLDMEYLYTAHDEIYEKASHHMLLLAQEAKRNKVKIAGLIPSLGRSTLEYYEVPDHLAYTEYGLFIKRRKSDAQEKAEFLLDVREAVKFGLITLSDSAFLRNIENLKEAREMMAIREQQNSRQAQQAEARNQQAALEANAQAAQLKTEGKMQEQAQQGGIDKELAIITGEIQKQIAQINNAMDAQGKQYAEQMKLLQKKQDGINRMVVQAMSNRVEEMKVDKRADKSPED